MSEIRAVRRGRLRLASDAPAEGERSDRLIVVGDRVVVEQILSGRVDGPVDYLEAQDEWVAVLTGGAVLEVGGEQVELSPGDWVLLPATVAHRLVGVDPGTSWLAVHFDGPADPGRAGIGEL
jgi:cupin 2 domain-containing protein